MNSLVVLFALCAVAYGSYIPVAQPPHLPALVLDARGRPLDTAEVINSRALHLQAKALEGHLGYGYGGHLVVSSLYGYGTPLLAHSGLGLTGHYLHKRSLGHYVHAAPAVSHQSRVDVIESPAVVSHAVVPVVAHGGLPLAHNGLIAGHGGLIAGHHGVIGGHHGVLTKINHAAVAPIGLAAAW